MNYFEKALKLGNLSLVKELVEKGADVRAYNDRALLWAVNYNHTEVVSFLQSVIDGTYKAIIPKEEITAQALFKKYLDKE